MFISSDLTPVILTVSSFNLANHFQLSLRSGTSSLAEEDVWILLTRHVVDTTRSGEFIALSAQCTQSSDTNAMYMKVRLVLILCSAMTHKPLQGSYTSSTHVLVRLLPCAMAQCIDP